MSPVLAVEDIHKTFKIGFFRKRVEAVRGVSFQVAQGETFGLLGPNGAGKTTTIKSILRLIQPDRGSIGVFGKALSLESMRRIGYMPENPYVYQYLRAPEFLDLCGRLMGMPRAQREKRSAEMIELVGLAHAVDRPIGRFSKGMTQRMGLAQALLHDPELLILDEPMSGLDPIGRKQVRDIILAQRLAGKTLIFTSHVLSDVEMLCDRIAIINKGRVVARGTLDELLKREVRRVRIQLAGTPQVFKETLVARGFGLREVEVRGHEASDLEVTIEGDQGVSPLLKEALEAGAQVVEVEQERETLEELFVRNAVASGD
ncbi:MAG: ABC transporter ATP-binding protein [Myxococcales bacterium]